MNQESYSLDHKILIDAKSKNLQSFILPQQEQIYPPPVHNYNQILLSQYAVAAKTIQQQGLLSIQIKTNKEKNNKYPLPLVFAYFQNFNKQKQYENCIKLFLNHLDKRLIKHNYVISYNIFYLYKQLHNHKAALFYLESALKEKPLFQQAIFQYVTLLVTIHRQNQAFQYLKRQIQDENTKISKSSNLKSLLIKYSYQLNFSFQQLFRVFNGKKNKISVIYNLGLYYKKIKDFLKAKNIFQQIIQTIQKPLLNLKRRTQKDEKILCYSKIILSQIYCNLSYESKNCSQIKIYKLKELQVLKSLFMIEFNFVKKYKKCIESKINQLQKQINQKGHFVIKQQQYNHENHYKQNHKHKYEHEHEQHQHLKQDRKQQKIQFMLTQNKQNQKQFIKNFNKEYQQKRKKNDKKLKFLLIKEKQINHFFKNLKLNPNDLNLQNLSFNVKLNNSQTLNFKYPQNNTQPSNTIIKRLKKELMTNEFQELQKEFQQKKKLYQSQLQGYNFQNALSRIINNLFQKPQNNQLNQLVKSSNQQNKTKKPLDINERIAHKKVNLSSKPQTSSFSKRKQLLSTRSQDRVIFKDSINVNVEKRMISQRKTPNLTFRIKNNKYNLQLDTNKVQQIKNINLKQKQNLQKDIVEAKNLSKEKQKIVISHKSNLDKIAQKQNSLNKTQNKENKENLKKEKKNQKIFQQSKKDNGMNSSQFILKSQSQNNQSNKQKKIKKKQEITKEVKQIKYIKQVKEIKQAKKPKQIIQIKQSKLVKQEKEIKQAKQVKETKQKQNLQFQKNQQTKNNLFLALNNQTSEQKNKLSCQNSEHEQSLTIIKSIKSIQKKAKQQNQKTSLRDFILQKDEYIVITENNSKQNVIQNTHKKVNFLTPENSNNNLIPHQPSIKNFDKIQKLSIKNLSTSKKNITDQNLFENFTKQNIKSQINNLLLPSNKAIKEGFININAKQNTIEEIFQSFNPKSKKNILINQKPPTSRDHSQKTSLKDISKKNLFSMMLQTGKKLQSDQIEKISPEFQQMFDEASNLQIQEKYEQAFQILTKMYKIFKKNHQKQIILLGLAYNFQKQSLFDQAEKTYLKCCKFNNYQAFMKLGQLQIRLNKIKSGVQNLQKANCIKRFDKQIQTKLVYGYSLNQDTIQKALSLANDILKRQPESLQILIMTVNILQKQNRIKQALDIAIAIDNHKQSQFIKHYIGILYLSDGNVIQAFKYFQQALQLKSNHVPSLIQIATILSQLKPKEAILILQKALQIQPNNRLALTRLGKIYESIENNPQKAMTIYKKTLQTKTNYEAFMKIGDCMQQNSCYLQALMNYKQALNLKKTYEAYKKIAQMHQKKQQYKKAVDNYRLALSLLPKQGRFFQTKKNIAISMCANLLILQDFDSIISQLQEIIQTEDNMDAYILLGKAYTGKNQYTIALEYYQKANQLTTEQNIELLSNMAICFDKSQQFLASKQLYQKILQIDPENTKAINNLANIHLIIGNTNQAFYWFEIMLQKIPKNLEKRLKICDIYSSVGDLSKVQYHLMICYKQKQHDIRVLQRLVNLYKEKRETKLAAKYQKKLTLIKMSKKQHS